MSEFRDIGKRCKQARTALWLFLAGQCVFAIISIITYLHETDETIAIFAFTASIYVAVSIICYVTVGSWIYRASWNAHQFEDNLRISPAWAVGWYFVPIANLFKPFSAMKEIWNASFGGGNYADDPPDILVKWWILWITSLFLENASTRLGIKYDSELIPDSVLALDLLTTAVTIPLTFILRRIILQITEAQIRRQQALVFS